MLSSASCGMPVGYSAILLPQLKKENDSLVIDEEIGSWIASIHSAATPLGSLLSGVFMDKCGRKLALQIASTPLIIGWVMIAFSSSHIMLLVGRLVAGMSAGLTAAAGQVLIGEITEPHLRGIFSSVPFASYSFGILLVYAAGSVLPWRYVAGLSTVLPIISICTFFALPESPAWLVRKGKFERAKSSLVWLRGGNTLKAKQETDHLIERLDLEQEKPGKNVAWGYFLKPEVVKPFLILNIFNVMQIFSGTYLIVFYAVDILEKITGSNNIDHFLAAVVTAGVRFIFTIFGTFALGLVGRRTLALSSGIGTTLSSFVLGTFLYLQNCHSNGYFAAFCIVIYVAMNTFGFMILPGVLLGELYPAKVRGLAGGLTFMTFNFLLFAVAKIFPYITSLVGVWAIFFIFGFSSLLGSVFLYFVLPETKGQTLSQIEDYFKRDNIFWTTKNNERLDCKTEKA